MSVFVRRGCAFGYVVFGVVAGLWGFRAYKPIVYRTGGTNALAPKGRRLEHRTGAPKTKDVLEACVAPGDASAGILQTHLK